MVTGYIELCSSISDIQNSLSAKLSKFTAQLTRVKAKREPGGREHKKNNKRVAACRVAVQVGFTSCILKYLQIFSNEKKITEQSKTKFDIKRNEKIYFCMKLNLH